MHSRSPSHPLTLIFPQGAQPVGGQLGLAVAGEEAFVVHAADAVDGLGGFEVAEVPDVLAGDVRLGVEQLDVAA